MTVNTGIAVVPPKLPTLLLTVARVVTKFTPLAPVKDTFGAVRSPEAEKFRAAARVVAVVALPVKAPTKEVEVTEVAPVTTPASTIIVPSRTIADPADRSKTKMHQ